MRKILKRVQDDRPFCMTGFFLDVRLFWMAGFFRCHAVRFGMTLFFRIKTKQP